MSATHRPAAIARVSTVSRLVVLGAMSLFAVYCLMPVWWLIVGATKPAGTLFTGSGFWFTRIDVVRNVAELFSTADGIFAIWLRNSLGYAVGGAVASTLVSAMMGYALAKYPFPGNKAVFTAVLGAVFIPAPIFAIPLYLLFSGTGLINTFWSVFIPCVVSPFGVYLSRIYAAESVPDEVIEAGRIDGAGEMRIFFQVGLRMMAPALLTIFLFQFVAIWTNYLLPSLMLANARLQPVTVGLIGWQQQRGFAVGYTTVVTGALISVIPIIAMFLSLQSFWSKGLAAGAIK
jgi:multiple sugar transport system permease protein